MRDAPQPTSRQEPCQGGRGQGGEYGVWTLDSTLNYLPPPPLPAGRPPLQDVQTRAEAEESPPSPPLTPYPPRPPPPPYPPLPAGRPPLRGVPTRAEAEESPPSPQWRQSRAGWSRLR